MNGREGSGGKKGSGGHVSSLFALRDYAVKVVLLDSCYEIIVGRRSCM